MSIKNLPVMRPNLQPKIYKSPVVAQQLYHMYATTRYNFVRLKAMHKISPQKSWQGGRSPPQQFPEVNRYGYVICRNMSCVSTCGFRDDLAINQFAHIPIRSQTSSAIVVSAILFIMRYIINRTKTVALYLNIQRC